jgi:2'-5' RNA ligase
MYPHFLAIPLPKHIQSRLAQLCYGLPQVHWVEEENFLLKLHDFGPLSNVHLGEIQDRLKSLLFSPFSLFLQGVGHFYSKKGHGTIWVGVADNLELFTLKKKVESQLRDLPLRSPERFHPHIILGYYDRLNPQKLGDYLSALADYHSEPIEVTCCLLMSAQQTPKRVIYRTVEQYIAMLPTSGED